MGLDQAHKSTTIGVLKLQHWLLPAILIALSAIAELGGDSIRESLRYARDPLGEGELWRLLSGHFVHLGWTHWLMNTAALVAIWLLVGSARLLWQWLLIVGIVLATIDTGFWWLDEQLRWYVGMSGLLHGLLVAGLLSALQGRPLESTLLLVLLAFKLGYEQTVGAMPGSAAAAGGPVVVNAHLYGALGGLLAHFVLRVSVGRRRSL